MPQLNPSPIDKAPVAASRFRWRKLFRFQLRTMFALMILVAVCLGWWSHRARQQRVAVAALNGDILYDFQLEEDLEGPRYWPKWTVEALGVDYFASVVGFRSFGDVEVSNAAYLKNLTTLQSLFLDDKHVTDECLPGIKNLTALEELNLSGSQVTDEGLAHLKNLPALKELDLSETQVTAKGLAYLKNFTTLKRLTLSYTRASDAGLEHLKDFKALETLDLNDTQVTDQGLAHLQNLSTLERLDLRGTKVTDVGLGHLKNLTTFKTLHLSETQVTKAGIASLQRDLPQCTIFSSHER